MGQELRVLAHQATDVSDHLLAHRQRHLAQFQVGAARCGHSAIHIGKEVVAVAQRWRRRRRPRAIRRLHRRTVAHPFPLAEFGHHLLDNGLNAGIVHRQSACALSYFTMPFTSTVSTMAMMTASQGRLSVSLVWRAALPVA